MLAGLLLGLVAFGLMGCDGSGSVYASFRTDEARYERGETIRAVFVNRTPETVYLHQPGCLLARLERRTAHAWEPVPLNIVCAAVVRPPLPVHSGTAHEVEIAGQILADSDVGAGTYRLVLQVARSKEETPRRVMSNPFAVQ